ncbi:MAG: GNAT family N-acetyltransferase [Pseudomonadota bacterium]
MIREATAADIPEIAHVFHAAIREGPSPYTEEQRQAWSREVSPADAWEQRLEPMHVVVADRTGVVGFMGVLPNGYVDLAFILPSERGAGLFRGMYSEIEAWAKAKALSRLETHASLIAEPPFAAVGFTVTDRESIERDGERLARASMKKELR